MTFVVRLATRDDLRAITNLALSTFALGSEVSGIWMRSYVEACTKPYLSGATGSVVAVDDAGQVIAYALVSSLSSRWEWRQRASVAVHLLSVPLALLGGGRPARQFYLDRCRDLPDLIRSAADQGGSPHAHFNITDGHRSGTVALTMLASVDAAVAETGAHRWFGEINARVGKRATALERLGFVVRHRVPNHTLTRLVGRPVERLVVERRLTDQGDVRDLGATMARAHA